MNINTTEEETIKGIYSRGSSYDCCNEPYKSKSLHVLWSGGCDSTLVLWKLLNDLKTNRNDRTIHTYAFISANVGSIKMDWEKQKRNQFLLWSSQQGFNNKIQHTDIHIDADKQQIISNNCGQPALWISNIVPYLPHDSILFSGYHKGDDFLTYWVFKDWIKAFVGLNNLYGKAINFWIPFMHTTKYEIIKQLKEVPGLYETTWWCEGQNRNGPCGHCDPCELHNMSLQYYESEYAKRQKCSLMSKVDEKKPEYIDVEMEKKIAELKDECAELAIEPLHPNIDAEKPKEILTMEKDPLQSVSST